MLTCHRMAIVTAKLVHPDLAGECAEELSTVLNAAASLMADAAFRERYAASCRQMREVRATGFTGRPLSTFAAGQEGRRQAIFVDETQCIGCMQCTYSAPDTFGLDDGRCVCCGVLYTACAVNDIAATSLTLSFVASQG